MLDREALPIVMDILRPESFYLDGHQAICMRSLWSAHYEVIENDQVDMHIREENPWIRVIESVLGEIPLIGFVFLYMLNPTYLITLADGSPALRAIKKPSIFERYFVIEKVAELDQDDELRALLSLIMMVLLEKSRG